MVCMYKRVNKVLLKKLCTRSKQLDEVPSRGCVSLYFSFSTVHLHTLLSSLYYHLLILGILSNQPTVDLQIVLISPSNLLYFISFHIIILYHNFSLPSTFGTIQQSLFHLLLQFLSLPLPHHTPKQCDSHCSISSIHLNP